MKLSIITVNLNNLNGLEKTVSSVLSQSWKDFEYFVIDGGSTGGSAQFLQKVSKDLTGWISEKDRGIYHAMNKGIAKATGEYLLFINSGDCLVNNNILAQVKDELTGEGIIYGDLTLIKKDGTIEPKIYPDLLTFSYVWEQSLPHPAAFIRKDMFEKLGNYNEKVRITSDWQFFMLALFSIGADYKHINKEITVFNLDGICNDPKNLKQILKEKRMFYYPKVLMVAMTDSIHTERWLSQSRATGHASRIEIFPSYELPTHRLARLMRSIKKRINPDYRVYRLARLIRRFKPDVIHSMETQGAGYLVERVRKLMVKEGNSFPKWWHSNWGSDIYLFGRLAEHQQRIRQVMMHCNYYSCEVQRDVELAKEFGFKGYPSGGGLKREVLEKLRKDTLPTSQRKVIMLKGYQGWAGRALVGIRALERCAEVLEGFTLVIYCNTMGQDIKIAAELLSQSTKMDVKLLPANIPNEEILAWHGKARISIGLSISDAISTSLLEAMAMGSFPIQSNTSCGDEWIQDGVTGILVPAEDPEIIEQAIRKALENDILADSAATVNYQKILEDADYDHLRELTLQSYFKVVKERQA